MGRLREGNWRGSSQSLCRQSPSIYGCSNRRISSRTARTDAHWIEREETRGRGTTMETATQTALVLAAQAGDQMAFETLTGPYRRELLVHCYRMLGSVHDAEDLVQETLLRAWEKRATFTSPGSYRAWLYRIATHLCLDQLRSLSRRSLPPEMHSPSDPTHPLPPRLREPI